MFDLDSSVDMEILDSLYGDDNVISIKLGVTK